MQITKLKITELDENKNYCMYIIYQLSVEEKVPTIVLNKENKLKRFIPVMFRMACCSLSSKTRSNLTLNLSWPTGGAA